MGMYLLVAGIKRPELIWLRNWLHRTLLYWVNSATAARALAQLRNWTTPPSPEVDLNQ
jgi:hypothetical protein